MNEKYFTMREVDWENGRGTWSGALSLQQASDLARSQAPEGGIILVLKAMPVARYRALVTVSDESIDQSRQP